jgi:hypothetical protein
MGFSLMSNIALKVAQPRKRERSGNWLNPPPNALGSCVLWDLRGGSCNTGNGGTSDVCGKLRDWEPSEMGGGSVVVNTMSRLSWPDGTDESSCSRKPHCAVHTSSRRIASRLASRSSCPQFVTRRDAHCACKQFTCMKKYNLIAEGLPG